MVLNYGEKMDPVKFKYLKINPQQNSRVLTKNMEKRYITVCQKGIIDKNLNVLPFGYNK
jgi:hypothetical protein